MDPKNIPTAEGFWSAWREHDYDRMRDHFRLVYDCMSKLAEASKPSTRKPAFFERDDDDSQSEIPGDHFEVFTITRGGQYWKWNCGWWEIDPVTRKVKSKTPLGHTAFKRKPLALPNDSRFIKLPRPTGPWRRVVKTAMSHPQFGNVTVNLTDGIIAMITIPALKSACGTFDLMPERKGFCMLENLNEIGTPMVRRFKTEKKVAKAAKPKELRVKKSLLDLL